MENKQGVEINPTLEYLNCNEKAFWLHVHV